MTFVRAVAVLAVIAAMLTGCATRTLYGKSGKFGGYEDRVLDSSHRATTFSGNSLTTVGDAKVFSVFRAIEVCRDKGYSVARIYRYNDLSVSKTVTRSESFNSQLPTYYTASTTSKTDYQNYGRNLTASNASQTSGSVTGGQTVGSTTSWNETETRPNIETIYQCTNSVKTLGFNSKDISVDNMKPLVKDLLGAVQIDSFINADTPPEGLKRGDIIVKINDERVTNGDELTVTLDKIATTSAKVFLFREGDKVTVNAKVLDGTEEVKRVNNSFVAAGCKASETKNLKICGGDGGEAAKDWKSSIR